MPNDTKRDAIEETNEIYRREGVTPPPVAPFMPRESANEVEAWRRRVTGPELAPVGTPGERVPPAYPSGSRIAPKQGGV